MSKSINSLLHRIVPICVVAGAISISSCQTRSNDGNTGAQTTGDIIPTVQQEINDSAASESPELISVSQVETDYGNLICLRPDMSLLNMDMVCGQIPDASNDSIVLAFAGAFTGKEFDKGHANICGDHVSGGKRFGGYRCKRNTGAFTWSPVEGAKFHYQNYSSAFDEVARNGGMGFAQEMMIHNGNAVKTTRLLNNENIFRALCLDSNGDLALYESQDKVTFGNFIEALLSQGVKEALYTDMGEGWNYGFYRVNKNDSEPTFLHSKPMSVASNFIVIKIK